MSALSDDRIYILVGQINFIFIDTSFFGILLNSYTNINQATAQCSGAKSTLTLVRLIDDDSKLATTELLHVFLGKEELLNRTNDNALFIVDGFRKAAGVLFIIDSFDQADLMLKAVDCILELAIQHNTVGDNDHRVKQAIILHIVNRCQAIGNPRNRVRLTGTSRVLNQIVSADAILLHISQNFLHYIVLMIAREDHFLFSNGFAYAVLDHFLFFLHE